MKRTKTLTTIFTHTSQNPQKFSPKPYKSIKKFQTLQQITPNSNQIPQKNPNSTNPSPQNPPNFITVCETLASYSNDFTKALDFFNWVEAESGFIHNTETYNAMIDILGKFFEFEKCWEMIQIMQKKSVTRPNHITFRIMFKRYVAAHYVREAVDVFDGLTEFGLKDETSFCNLIDAMCEYKHVVEAEELWVNRRFRGVEFVNETKVYNMLVRGFAKMGWWSKCREFWELMDRKGVRKDVVSYSIFMDVQCKCGKPYKAVQLYKEMRRKRVKLDVVAYNIVINAVGVKEGVDSAIRMLREMRDLGCVPNVATYNTVVKLLCDDGRTREAYGMVDQMRKSGCEPDVMTYHCFFRCLVKPKELIGLFERMLESGVRPRMDTYVMLMRKFGRWGFLRPVMFVWEKMKELGSSPNEAAYNSLIDALLQKGLVDLAKKYDDEMLAKGLSAKPRVELGTKAVDGMLDDVEL
ncbi:hypothetical protein vseg_016313 [Gypsophila vaccaria]